MAHIFDHRKMTKLDSPERRKILPPREILCEMGLHEGDIFLDIGAGIGYFSFPAAEIVGKNGKIIATDVSKEMIQELRKRIDNTHIQNIDARQSDGYDIMVEDRSVTFAFMSTVLHEVDDKVRFLTNAKNTLQKNGRLGIVEWIKKTMEMGPPIEERLEPEEVSGILREIGMKVLMVKEYNDYFYYLLAENVEN
jgi:ubiquinone/menaquinone biosynthesis C-methylase UbiE